MKICLSGAHGTGKTTLINMLKDTLPSFTIIESPTRNIKRNYPNLSGDELQKKILEKHNLNSLCEGNIIYDRCALDLIVYSVYDYNRGKVSRNCLNDIYMKSLEILKRYDKIYYLEPEFKLIGDDFRSDNETFQEKIVDIFRKYIKKLNLEVTLLEGPSIDRFNKIISDVEREC